LEYKANWTSLPVVAFIKKKKQNPISNLYLLNSDEKNVPTEARLSARVKSTVLCIKFSSQLINAKERMRLFELDEV